jgi:hypothetical protein
MHGSETRAFAEYSYAYKPSLLGAPREFALTVHALQWRAGGSVQEIPFAQIRRVRMSSRPATIQTYRFLTEIWPLRGPRLEIASTSWRGIVDQERFDDAYVAFVTELNRRIGASGARASFEGGAVPVIYWMGVAVFVGVTLATAFLLAKAIFAGALLPAAVIGGLLALFTWQMGNYFRRNRPRTYDPNNIPADLLPRT